MMACIGLALLWFTARQLRIAHLRDQAKQRQRTRWTRIDAYLPSEEREEA